MKRGQIDQILTSVIVLFVVFVLMVFFVIVSSNVGSVGDLIGQDSEASSSVPHVEKVESRVLLDTFLSDTVLIDNRQISIRDLAIHAATTSDEAQATLYAQEVESLFNTKYSCGGNNRFVLIRFNGEATAPSGTRDRTVSFDRIQVFANLPSRSFILNPPNQNVGGTSIDAMIPSYSSIASGFDSVEDRGFYFAAYGRTTC